METLSTLRHVPSDLDIPLQVQVPNAGQSSGKGGVPSSGKLAVASGGESVRAVLKYNNDEGRKAILDMAINVHHDFGKFNSSLSVSLTPSNLALVKSNPNVNWFEGDGRVIYCSIR